MIKTVFDSDALPPDERLARFDDCQLRSDHPMGVIAAEPAGFHATARALDIASVNLMELTCSPADVRRTPRMIRAADPELYSVVLPLSGSIGLTQGERQAEIGVGEMSLYTSSHPFRVLVSSSGGGTTRLLRAHLPRTLLPLPGREIDRLAATRLSGRSGVGALLTGFLAHLTADATAYTPADTARLGSVAVDLVTAALAHQLDTGPAYGPGQAALLPRIKAFIQRHLDDPDLTPTAVAAAHHISVSYLHRLFQAHEMTAAAWIRRQRLDRAARDLADPALREIAVHRIAVRWGFTDHAGFTRAFRTTYDVPPRDYRQRALTAAAAAAEHPRAVRRRRRARPRR